MNLSRAPTPSNRYADAADLDVLVVGGGVSGLACAWWLQQSGITAALWEREPRVGGKIRTDITGGYLTERAAAVVMNFRPEVAQFLAESGLNAAKAPRRAAADHRYLVDRKRLLAVPMAIGAMIRSPLWSARGRLRLLLEPLICRGGDDAETVSAFVRRRFGGELLEKAMEPFVSGTLASDPDRASARATLPRLTALERRYGSIALGILIHKLTGRRRAYPTESFSFQGGMETLARTLAVDRALCVRTARGAISIQPHAAGWRVHGVGDTGECSLVARQVVLCVPAQSAANLLAPLDGEISRLLRRIAYAPLAVVHLGLAQEAVAHALNGAGFLAPRREELLINGNLWMSSMFSGRAPEGRVLLTSYVGGARRPEAIEWDDARTISAALEALRPLLGISGTPEMARIDRHGEALPLYHGDHLGRIASIDRCLERLPGLHLAANYRDGISIRDRIACAQVTARRIARAFAHRPRAPECRPDGVRFAPA